MSSDRPKSRHSPDTRVSNESKSGHSLARSRQSLHLPLRRESRSRHSLSRSQLFKRGMLYRRSIARNACAIADTRGFPEASQRLPRDTPSSCRGIPHPIADIPCGERDTSCSWRALEGQLWPFPLREESFPRLAEPRERLRIHRGLGGRRLRRAAESPKGATAWSLGRQPQGNDLNLVKPWKGDSRPSRPGLLTPLRGSWWGMERVPGAHAPGSMLSPLSGLRFEDFVARPCCQLAGLPREACIRNADVSVAYTTFYMTLTQFKVRSSLP